MRIIQGDAEKRMGVHYEYDPWERPLGTGGMGVVYRGWRFDDYAGQQREVAIKELNLDLPPHVIMRARREAALRLRSDCLVEMIDFVEMRSKDVLGGSVMRYYVISEFLHGTTLDSLLKGNVTDYKGEVIPFAQELYGKYLNDPYHFALMVVRSVLSGLMSLHDAGYIHRDIDPSNIMVTSDGHIKLIDFGVVKDIKSNHTDETPTQIGQFIGKPKYAAPELVKGLTDALGVPTDLYAVGILLFQLVTGHVPFDGGSAEVLLMQMDKKMPLHEVKQAELRKVIRMATQKNKERRFQSAAEFCVAVERLVPLSYPGKKLYGLKFGAAAVVSALLVWGGLGMFGNDDSESVVGRAAFVDAGQRREEVSSDVAGEAAYRAELPYADVVALLKNEATAEYGLEQLEILTNSSSSETRYKATFLLSRLYFENEADKAEEPDSIGEMRRSLRGTIHIDNKKAHALLKKAIAIDGEDYHSLYELGCNYMSKNKRGASKDLNLAKTYLLKALDLAEQAGDQEYKTRIEKRLSIL